MTAKPAILVTGGAGYIGSHACKKLSRSGFVPVAFDNLVYGHEWAVKWGPFETGDLTDRQRLDAVIENHKPVAIMHFAAYAYVGESVTDPGRYYRNNVTGSLTLLEAARDHGIGNIVFSSTCAVYGVPEALPITEGSQPSPINPYGQSKLMVEHMLADFERAHGIRHIALRYFNAAGADPDGELGEHHDPETHLIPLALDAAAGTRPHFTMFGDDYPTPDGSCIRDFVHVSDLADAHVLALRHLQSGGTSQTLNLGTGRGHSVREVVDCARTITGREIKLIVAPRRPGDPPELIADARKARDMLGWTPKLSSLDKMLNTAWKSRDGEPASKKDQVS